MDRLGKKKQKGQESLEQRKGKIHYDEDLETDTFDFYEDEEPFKEIQVT